MGKSGHIEHEGIIKEISQNKITVGFVSQPSCIGCHAKGVCNMDQQDGKHLNVFDTSPDQYSIGEKVKIVIKETLGLKAVFIAYIIPFILLMVTLFVMEPVLKSEIRAGLMALAMLVPYYLLVFLYKDRIQKEINFNLEKLS
jgi:positive regulator of sigma E activity